MKLSTPFWITIGVFVALSALVLGLTWNNPTFDGVRALGFPIPFYTEGGFCIHGCNTGFSIPAFIVDLLIWSGIAYGIQWFFARRSFKNK